MDADGAPPPPASSEPKSHARTISADPLLTVVQVAEQLQTSDRTILRLIATKELRAVRIGRLWRVRPRNLEEYPKLNASR